MLSNHLILCSPFLLLLSIFLSIRVFSSELALHIRWPGGFSSSLANEYSGLISFRVDLLAVHRTLESLLQHHNSKASVLQHSSLLYDPALTSAHDYWKNHSFDYTEFCQESDVSLFNMLSRFVIAFLPRNKHLLTSWQILFINNWYHWPVWAAEYHTIHINSKFNPPSNMPPDSQGKQPWGKISIHTKLFFLPRSFRDNPFPLDCQWSNYQKLCTVSDYNGEYKYMCVELKLYIVTGISPQTIY